MSRRQKFDRLHVDFIFVGMQGVAILALVVRISIALSTRTFFQPDEYFQSLEPAHHFVFGYGELTWEWLTSRPVRSVLYAALNVPVYWILKVTKLDETWLLIACPRIIHGAFAALTDIWVAHVGRQVLGERYLSTIVFLSLTSPFHALALSRSLSNSLETSLTTIAISYYPWDVGVLDSSRFRGSLRKTLLYAAIACAIRPTNAVIWIYLIPLSLWRVRKHRDVVLRVVLDAAMIGTSALALLFVIDSIYFGVPTLTPVNFLITNMTSVSVFYGSSPWHYYLSQGLPVLCSTTLPFLLHGMWLAVPGSPLRTLLGCVGWTTLIYSLARHKEWRFLHPLLPMMHVVASKSIVDLTPKADTDRDGKKTGKSWLNRCRAFLLLLNIPAIVMAVWVHSDGPIKAIDYLRGLPSSELGSGSVGFLMPCHSTPWQSYLHRKELDDHGRLWAIGCEPPLGNHDLMSYKDQSDVFYESPHTYLTKHFPPVVNRAFPPSRLPRTIPGGTQRGDVKWDHEWPLYLVMFGSLLESRGVKELLLDKGYRKVWEGGSGFGDGKRKGKVNIWRCTDL